MPPKKDVSYHGINKSATPGLETKYMWYSKFTIDPSQVLLFFSTPIRHEFDYEMPPASVIGSALVGIGGMDSRPKIKIDPKQSLLTTVTPELKAKFRVKSYFAFELDRKITNWHFNIADLGITAKEDYDDKNTNIHRVDQIIYFNDNGVEIDIAPSKYRFGNPDILNETCRFVVIGMRQMGENEAFRFNLHVNMPAGSGTFVPTVFDPDIKNDGGGFGP